MDRILEAGGELDFRADPGSDGADLRRYHNQVRAAARYKLVPPGMRLYEKRIGPLHYRLKLVAEDAGTDLEQAETDKRLQTEAEHQAEVAAAGEEARMAAFLAFKRDVLLKRAGAWAETEQIAAYASALQSALPAGQDSGPAKEWLDFVQADVEARRADADLYRPPLEPEFGPTELARYRRRIPYLNHQPWWYRVG